MSFWKKLFSSSTKEKNNAILVYVDADLKRGVELTRDQTVKEYELDNNFD
jgi:hypothetical protein